MHLALVALIAIASATLVAVIILVAIRRSLPARAATEDVDELRQRDAELAALRQAKVESDRGWAVAEEKASRIPALEVSLREARDLADRLREERTVAERAHSATKEALSARSAAALATEEHVDELSRDLEASDSALAEAQAGKGKAEEALAARSEAVERLEATGSELRNRLAVGDQARAELASECDALRSEKGKVEEALSAKAEAVDRLEAAEREIRERLGASEQAKVVLSARCDAVRNEKAALESEAARMQETLSQERKQTDEKLALLNDAKTRLTEQFSVVAEEVMGRHGEAFKQQNKEQLDGVLAPLREQITGFQHGLQTAHVESAKDRERLAEQIRSLLTTGVTMTNETRNLTQALRGEAQTQGAWGEMILGTILQRSGLREGEEYVTQETHSTEEGARLRPDVIVNLPDDKRIVIDSKVSLSAFTDYVNAVDGVAKAEHLARHVASMRSHIKGLSRKEYQQVTTSGLDCVIMFVPIEGALAAALQDDPALTSFAAEHNVAIGTPTTLMLALRTVAQVWHVERRNKNAEEMGERAGKLYDKFVGFVVDMKTLGGQLDRTSRAYNDAFSKLQTGPGNLIRQAEMLKELGARTAKALPVAVAADAHASDEAAPVGQLNAGLGVTRLDKAS